MKKHISLILKILAVCVALSLILIVVLTLTKNKNINNTTNEKKQETNNVIQQFSKEELTAIYKSKVTGVLGSFDGNYENLRNGIVSIQGVPIEYQTLHFDLVVALDYLVFKDDKSSSKERLQKIYEDNDWLQVSLDKVIQSIN